MSSSPLTFSAVDFPFNKASITRVDFFARVEQVENSMQVCNSYMEKK